MHPSFQSYKENHFLKIYFYILNFCFFMYNQFKENLFIKNDSVNYYIIIKFGNKQNVYFLKKKREAISDKDL